MNNQNSIRTLFIVFFILMLSLAGFGQSPTLLKRTAYKTDSIDFGAGGTLSVTGAPAGSIAIEGWDKAEIEVSAEIEMQAATEADLAQLATVNSYIIDQGFNSVRIVSVGTFDKDYMKRTAKKFPKNLLGLPFKIDYKIKVPRYADLNITGGNGDFSLTGVDGEIYVKFLDSNAKLNLVGGSVQATFGKGTVDISIPTRGWRGRFADVQLAAGTMSVIFPPNFNAEIEAAVLREGKIENSFAELKPKTKNAPFGEKTISAKAGVGGIPLKFTVGDGTLKLAGFKKAE
ncbi:MAG: hypothetical protein JSS81_15645 [Acidobacteria bacterium]|nr:hypothetical protein [Acidobacteriota bacterium]